MNDGMHMTTEGLALLTEREGVDLVASLSGIPGDPWTIGIGHTHFDGPPIPVRGMRITEEEATAMLPHDLVRYEDIVKKNIVVPLADHEFDALTSICYNVEAALGPQSSVVKFLNRGDRAMAAHAIMLYVKPPEIRHRRETEYHQFLTPYEKTPTPTADQVTTAMFAAGAKVAAGESPDGANAT